MAYALFNLLHVLGAILFLGNLLVTAWWKVRADRTGRPLLVGYALREVQLTDRVFTLGGAALLLVGGIGMLVGHGWLRAGIALFVFSAALWAVVLLPLQVQMRRVVRGTGEEEGTDLPAEYRRLSRYWALAGIAATLLPLVALVLMVVKPG